jgi:hypothetical protein
MLALYDGLSSLRGAVAAPPGAACFVILASVCPWVVNIPCERASLSGSFHSEVQAGAGEGAKEPLAGWGFEAGAILADGPALGKTLPGRRTEAAARGAKRGAGPGVGARGGQTGAGPPAGV